MSQFIHLELLSVATLKSLIKDLHLWLDLAYAAYHLLLLVPYLPPHPHKDCKTHPESPLFQMKIWEGTKMITHNGTGTPSYWWGEHFGTHSAKALLLVLLFGGAVGKNSVPDTKAELGGDSGWLSVKLSGRMLVTCWDWVFAGSVENDSTWLPNRWCDRCKYKARYILIMK